MEAPALVSSSTGAASLIVVAPGGHRSRVPITPLPFTIGRQAENHLVLRDSRASRSHARIVLENGAYVIEDASSRHGTFVNGKQITRQALNNSDRIDFGVEDSYQLIFHLDGTGQPAPSGVNLAEKTAAPPLAPAPVRANLSATGGGALSAAGVGGNLAKLRALLDLALTLQGSFSISEVLASVVDTALAVTGAERGFLLLRSGEGLDTRVARNRNGHNLDAGELRVPRNLIRRALEHRRELLSMNFDPLEAGDERPQNSIADLELRSAICLPLVRIRAGQTEGPATNVISAGAESVGVLYMDSRIGAADLTGGNRELLQALAIEASTILENARLLEEERAKQQMEEELRLAHTIQQSLLPKSLPADGWIRARGSSIASREVGGDYFDVAQVHRHCWSAVVADVSGKGVSSALLASLLQGALITASAEPRALHHRIERLNRFLYERTGGEKYATIFYCLISAEGMLHYINAAHCPPLLFHPGGPYTALEATGMPVGLLEEAEFTVGQERIEAGDRLVIYSDGVTEAQNSRSEFFGAKRLREVVAAHANESCAQIHNAIHAAVAAFTEGAPQSDDITLLVLEIAALQPVIG
ncbi:MAG TPA: SpoIIE family protein phosphatase [Bryobacteraceae bacterium]|nr:SpoIIE family protein phosphatase [Bryobacteraceae bacterium]